MNRFNSKLFVVSANFKGQLLQTYCCSWYGCQTWDLVIKSAQTMAVEWNKAVRRTLGIGIDHDTRCAGRPAGTTRAVPDCSTNHSSADRISGQFLFYHDPNFTKSRGNLRFRRLVPLFVPIDDCVTTYDAGTASDVTIGM